MRDAPTLDVVIVDYNSGEFLAACLASIARHRPAYAQLRRVRVVDNGSVRPAAECIEPHDLPLRVIRNEENRGFAAACNQGAAGSMSDYLLFLNPDTQLAEGSLDIPVRFLEDPANARVGIVGVQLLDDDGRVARSCSYHPRPWFYFNRACGLDRVSPRRFPNGFMLDWDHGSNRVVDSVMGAFYLVRRELFDRLGGFDERYFVYFEETDFSLRAARLGYRNVYLADARAYHKGRGSSDKVRRQRLVYFVQSQLTFGRAHFSRPGAAALVLITLVGEPVARVVRFLWKRSWGDVADSLAAYAEVWRWFLRPQAPHDHRTERARKLSPTVASTSAQGTDAA